jgi:hypothetical protein
MHVAPAAATAVQAAATAGGAPAGFTLLDANGLQAAIVAANDAWTAPVVIGTPPTVQAIHLRHIDHGSNGEVLSLVNGVVVQFQRTSGGWDVVVDATGATRPVTITADVVDPQAMPTSTGLLDAFGLATSRAVAFTVSAGAVGTLSL